MTTELTQTDQVWCGLRVAGGAALGELAQWQRDSRTPDIEFIRRPNIGSSGARHGPRTLLCHVTPNGEWELTLPSVATARICRGRVEYTCTPNSGLTEIKPLFYGPVLSACSTQLGFLSVRGTVILGPQGAILLCGASGVGKTAIATLLIKMGLQLVSDGTSILTIQSNPAVATAYATHPWIYIWRRGAFSVGLDIDRMSKWRAGIEKYACKISRAADPFNSFDIGRIVAMHRSSDRSVLREMDSTDSAAYTLRGSIERQFGFTLVDKQWSNAIEGLASVVPVYSLAISSDQLAAEQLVELVK